MASVEVGDDGDEEDLLLEPFEDQEGDMLHQRMNTDDDIRPILHQPFLQLPD